MVAQVAKANWPDPVLNAVLLYEGGWSNNPHDPGGATMCGVTQRVYDAYRTHLSQPRQTVRNISNEEIDDIYYIQYWTHIMGDELPSGLDLSVADCCVNSGPVEAIKLLQRVLSIKADGQFGIVTLNEVTNKARDQKWMINTYNDHRLGFLHRLRTWNFFSKGWTNRIAAVRKKSLTMVDHT